MQDSPLLSELKRKLAFLPLGLVPAAELEAPRPTLQGIKDRLRALQPRPGEPVFDFHGFVEITSNNVKEFEVNPEDEVLLLPKGTRTRDQRNEVLNHPRTRDTCKRAKAKKKDATRRKKRAKRKEHEAEIERNGGTIGKLCKGGTHYATPAPEVIRRRKAMEEINTKRSRSCARLKLPTTINLPPPRQLKFRKGAEYLTYDFTLGQLLPTVDLVYPETEPRTSPHRYSEVACTWAGNISYWERDFDITFTLADETMLDAQIQCKGFGGWYKSLFNSLASSDWARSESSAPFLSFFRTFRRMTHFAIRHYVNYLQCEYQNVGTPLPLLYASYSSLKEWQDKRYRLDSAESLLALYEAETAAFWRRFQRLYERLFPREWSILDETISRTRERCAGRKEFSLRLSAEDIASLFADRLKEVKAEIGYDNDREMCRSRFIQLVKQVNDRSRDSRMTREQALYHLLPRKPRKGP